MNRFRYRTAALIGPWRERRDEAVHDAVRSRQAQVEPEVGKVVWTVPGRIEDSLGEAGVPLHG